MAEKHCQQIGHKPTETDGGNANEKLVVIQKCTSPESGITAQCDRNEPKLSQIQIPSLEWRGRPVDFY